MTTVTVFTAERMQAIEDGTVIDGEIVGDHLILERHDGTTIDAGALPAPATGSRSIKQIVIASVEANDNSKETADFVCDGTDDQEEFLAAYLQIEGDGSWGPAGEILFTEGTFYFDLTVLDLELDISYINMRGQGIENTSIAITHPTSDGMALDHCLVQDLGFSDVESTTPRQMIQCGGGNTFERCNFVTANLNTGVKTDGHTDVFRDCSFLQYMGDDTISLHAYYGAVVENCSFEVGNGYGIYAYAPEDSAYFHNLRISGCRFVGYNGSALIYFYEAGTDVHGTDALITDCVFDVQSSINHGIYADEGAEFVRSNLTITNCFFRHQNTTTSSINLTDTPGVLISNCRFHSAPNGVTLTNCHGAKVIGNQFHSCEFSITASTSHQVRIENNSIYGGEDITDSIPPWTNQTGITVDSGNEAFVIGNTLDFISAKPIVILTANRAYVGENKLFRCGVETDNTFSGIKLTAADDCSIVNNFATSAANAVKLKYALEIVAGCDRTYVRGNHFYDAADTAAILDGGTSTDTTSANKVS